MGRNGEKGKPLIDTEQLSSSLLLYTQHFDMKTLKFDKKVSGFDMKQLKKAGGLIG